MSLLLNVNALDTAMASEKKIIQPVWGMSRRKVSTAMLDTAETLVENLDDISDVLDQLTEKYEKETASVTTSSERKHENIDVIQSGDINQSDSTKGLKPTSTSAHDEQANARLFLKLKSGLDAARKLIECLRCEKRRIMKREMSVECRIDEIQDYKEHIKHDLTSLNSMIDLLSFRIQQQEQELGRQQELVEALETDKLTLAEKLEVYETEISDLKSDNEILVEQALNLRRERTNTSLMLQNKELLYKIEMLIVENAKLKEMVRKYNEDEIQSVSSEGDLGQSRDTNDDGTNNNFQYSAQYSTTSGEDSDA